MCSGGSVVELVPAQHRAVSVEEGLGVLVLGDDLRRKVEVCDHIERPALVHVKAEVVGVRLARLDVSGFLPRAVGIAPEMLVQAYPVDRLVREYLQHSLFSSHDFAPLLM